MASSFYGFASILFMLILEFSCAIHLGAYKSNFSATGLFDSPISVEALTSAIVNEGECFDPPNPVFPTLNLDWAFNTLHTRWFTPLGSAHAFRLTAEWLLGRSPYSEAELEFMNLRGMNVDDKCIVEGYSQIYVKTCTSRKGDDECTITDATPGSKAPIKTKIHETVVWTNNLDTMLIVRCIDSTSKDWIVYSTFPVLSLPTVQKIIKVVYQLGFNLSFAQYFPYH